MMTPTERAARIVDECLIRDIGKAIRDAVAAEREACAKVADANTFHGLGADVGMGIAAAIRARSET